MIPKKEGDKSEEDVEDENGGANHAGNDLAGSQGGSQTSKCGEEHSHQGNNGDGAGQFAIGERRWDVGKGSEEVEMNDRRDPER